MPKWQQQRDKNRVSSKRQKHEASTSSDGGGGGGGGNHSFQGFAAHAPLAAVTASNGPPDWSTLKPSQLKAALTERGIDHSGCIEKGELVALLKKNDATAAPSSSSQPLDDPFLISPPPPARSDFYGPQKVWKAGKNQWNRGGGSSARPTTYRTATAAWFDEDDNLAGFLAMEKFDGYRAVWWPSGHEKSPCFLTRNGSPFKPPPSWNALLPKDMRLDGEIWAGRGGFEHVGALIGTSSLGLQQYEKCWQHLCFVVFDAPVAGPQGPFTPYVERLDAARRRLSALQQQRLPNHHDNDTRVQVVVTLPCESHVVRKSLLQRVQAVGGEGLVLRRASSAWSASEGGQQRDLLKVKPWLDAECQVIQFNSGVSSLHCKALNAPNVSEQPVFDVTWGNRKDPIPPVGAVLTYRYQNGLLNGMPRHQSVLKVHDAATCDCGACRMVAARAH